MRHIVRQARHAATNAGLDFGKLLEDEGIIFTTLGQGRELGAQKLHLAAGIWVSMLRD